jgi:hypothetical protein
VKLLVDGGGYVNARTAFEDANQVAALQYDSLTGKLAGYAAMAGDDGASAEFAAAYDDAAGQATGALADLVAAFATVGHLTEVTRLNHRDANVSSIIGGGTVQGGDLTTEDGFATVTPTETPSALGGATPSLPFPVGLLLEAIDGFVWPNADVDRLRDAALTWRGAAESLDNLRDYCDAAIAGFERQRSPEIPVAIDAISELQAAICVLEDQYAALAASCDAYATSVEEKRQEIIDLGLEVLRVVAEEAALSVGLGLVTAGIGAAGKGALAAARIAAYAPRFAAILAALRVAGAAAATTIRTGTAELRAVRGQLLKFVHVLAERSVARGEAGSIGPFGRWTTWLAAHEHSGSHTLARHAGKSDQQILGRLSSNPSLRVSSTFTDERTAADAIDHLLRQRRRVIDQWLRHGEGRLALDGDAGRIVGRLAHQGSEITESSKFRAVLVPDDRMPEGWRVLTAFVTK